MWLVLSWPWAQLELSRERRVLERMRVVVPTRMPSHYHGSLTRPPRPRSA